MKEARFWNVKTIISIEQINFFIKKNLILLLFKINIKFSLHEKITSPHVRYGFHLRYFSK